MAKTKGRRVPAASAKQTLAPIARQRYANLVFPSQVARAKGRTQDWVVMERDTKADPAT